MCAELSIVGKRLPRADAVEKVTGEVKFISDIMLPQMLYTRFLRSPHAHARIVRIDTAKAEALPGVKCILTHKNVPKVQPRGKLEYLLDETVHFAGEEVAVVAAVTEEIAEEALKLIEVEYEVLPAVFDIDEAMKPGAPLAHLEYGTNFFHGSKWQPVPRCTPDGWQPLEFGDVDRGFEEADYIVDGNYETSMQYHCSPVPRTVVCQWSGDRLTCWADTQVTMEVLRDLSRCLGISQSRIRVIAAGSVGGYGGKEPEKIATLTALLAREARRPVRTAFTREEDIIATKCRPAYKTYCKIGVKRDGTITAIYNRIISNHGRDGLHAFLMIASAEVGTCSMLYRYQNSRAEGATIITNIVDHGGMNGFGDTEACFWVERMIDEAAEKIEMDPVDFRLQNCMRYGDKGMDFYPVITGPVEWGIVGPDIDSLPECIQKVSEKSLWKEKWQGWKRPVEINGVKRKGIGIGLGMHHSWYHPFGATVKMSEDGTATVLTMGNDFGQGFHTAVVQTVAETLGLHFEDVHVILADSSAAPPGTGNVGSCGVSSGVTATRYAALKVRDELMKIASERLGVEPDALELKERRIYIKSNPERGISIAEACLVGFNVIGSGVTPPTDSIKDEKTGKTIHAYAVAATIVELEVDIETGQVDVLRITSAHDCGKVINPIIIENQIDLALSMSNGWVRSESIVIDKNMGVMLNPNLLDYKIMTFLDMPKMEDMRVITVEKPCAWGCFGAKGMAETGATSVAPAIANAIYNAIGVRIRGDHFTPDRILEALGK